MEMFLASALYIFALVLIIVITVTQTLAVLRAAGVID
jgi:hypothetical protein